MAFAHLLIALALVARDPESLSATGLLEHAETAFRDGCHHLRNVPPPALGLNLAHGSETPAPSGSRVRDNCLGIREYQPTPILGIGTQRLLGDRSRPCKSAGAPSCIGRDSSEGMTLQ